MVLIDRYNHSVTESFFVHKKNKSYNSRKVWYNRKTPRLKRKVKQLINYAYENKKPNERFYFATITTQQQKRNVSDKECYLDLRRWIKNKPINYVNVAERQRNGDLHFHLFIVSSKDFDIQTEVKRLANIFGVEAHPAIFDIKRIKNIGTVIGYITKYVTKQGRDYSSLFTCRTFSYSQRLSNEYKKNAYKSTIKTTTDLIKSYPHLFVEKYRNDFNIVYEYNIDIWKVAQQFKAKSLRL